MTFLSVEEARETCNNDFDRYNEAQDRLVRAQAGLESARETLESARSVWDGSTFGTGAGAVTIILACLLPEPFSKSICVAGLVGGGLGVAGSEVDRQVDISNAEAGVEQAELMVEMAEGNLEMAAGAAFSCVMHHISKGAR